MGCGFLGCFPQNGGFHLFLWGKQLLFCESPNEQAHMARNNVSNQQPIVMWGSLLVDILTAARNEMLITSLWEILSQKHPE